MTSWQAIRFVNPARDGAVLLILRFHGHKFAGSAIIGRMRDEELDALLRGRGYKPALVAGRRLPH